MTFLVILFQDIANRHCVKTLQTDIVPQVALIDKLHVALIINSAMFFR